MILKNRAKIAKELNSILNINIDRDFVYNIIEFNKLKILGGVIIDSFNSPDTYRPHMVFIPIFIPEDNWNISYGWTMKYFHACQEYESISVMVNEYLNYISPINNLTDFYSAFKSGQIPNMASRLHTYEILIYLAIILGRNEDYYAYGEQFRILAAENTKSWSTQIIKRVKIIESLISSNSYSSIINQLISWQNFTVKALKLPSDLLVELQ